MALTCGSPWMPNWMRRQRCIEAPANVTGGEAVLSSTVLRHIADAVEVDETSPRERPERLPPVQRTC